MAVPGTASAAAAVLAPRVLYLRKHGACRRIVTVIDTPYQFRVDFTVEGLQQLHHMFKL
jgi:hypothetical protein